MRNIDNTSWNSDYLTINLLTRVLIILILCASTMAFASAADLRATIDSKIAVSGVVFDGGRVELAPSGRGNLHSLLINGSEVALVFRHVTDRLPTNSDARFLVRMDEEGVSHLIGITWTSPRTGRSEQRLFRIAAVASSPRPAPTVARLSGKRF